MLQDQNFDGLHHSSNPPTNAGALGPYAVRAHLSLHYHAMFHWLAIDMDSETNCMMTSRHTLFLSYLKHYADMNLDAVAGMLADDVKLRDWNLAVVGKAATLAETAKNFASSQSIAIEVLGVYENQSTVSGELRILVNGDTELYVVDVINFNAQNQIQAIRAYLGRGDDIAPVP